MKKEFELEGYNISRIRIELENIIASVRMAQNRLDKLEKLLEKEIMSKGSMM